MKNPIQSVKHYNQYPITTVVDGVIAKRDFVVAKELTAISSPVDTPEGAVVKAVFLEMWVIGSGNQNGTFIMTIDKQSGPLSDMTVTNLNNLGSYNNKKNVLYVTQGLFPEADNNPINIYRTWIKIPKGKQRFGLGDKLVMNLIGQGADIKFCGFITFKHYQ